MGLSRGCSEHPDDPYDPECTRCNPKPASGGGSSSNGSSSGGSSGKGGTGCVVVPAAMLGLGFLATVAGTYNYLT